MARKSTLGPPLGLPLVVIELTTSSMNASNTPPGEEIINSRPVQASFVTAVAGLGCGVGYYK
jgi:hypothetical protein